MNAGTLEVLFSSLGEPPAGELSTRVLANSSLFRIGRGADGAAFLLIELSEDIVQDDFVLRLQHVEYRPRERVRWEDPGRPSREGVFAIIGCRNADEELRGYFFRIAAMLVDDLGAAPTTVEVDRAVTRVLELFRNLQQAGTSTVQGTWAELLLIASSRDVAIAVAAWHANPNEKFDFAAGDERLEVKSTLNELRIHEVSLEQVRPSLEGSTLLASFLVARSRDGQTIGELVERIGERIMATGHGRELVHRVETIVSRSLGAQWRESATARFDVSAAMHSLRFFDVRAVPSVDPSMPAEVRNVRFAVDLSAVPALAHGAAVMLGGLFGALLPPNAES